MKKNLIAMGVAAALSAPMAAQALDAGNGHNVEIYGRFQAELVDVSSDVSDFDSSLPAGSQDPRHLDDLSAGKWGIFATEKLGNGWTAFGRYEFEEASDDANTDDPDRNQYVGIKGNWGLFLAGRHDTPWKFTGGTKADPFIATHLEARRGGGMSSGLLGQGSRADNILVYASPDFNGFNFTLAYNGENDDEVGDDDGSPAGDPTGGVISAGGLAGADAGSDGFYSIGAQYKNGPLWVWAAYNDGQDLDPFLMGDYDGWKIGAAYTYGNHGLRFQYEDQDNFFSTGFGGDAALVKGGAYSGAASIGAEEAEFLWIAYTFTMGNNDLMLSYGEEDYEDVFGRSGVDDEIKSYTVALRHKMSKTFNVFGGWKRYEVDSESWGGTDFANPFSFDEDIDILSIGLRKDFKI